MAEYYEKHTLYNEFLLPRGIDFTTIISKKLLPDSAIYVEHKDVSTMFIIEKKYQGGSGSVDEKLQTCDFKKKQYEKLLRPLGIEVEYIYLLNDWFDQPMYTDVFEYIKSVGCDYYINEIPLTRLKLE
ncbi:PD-(D/E)XK nuclease superfamily protein [Myroides odoratimimus]|uniref:PD-(D/E)XK nuclease superfamily protein n=1 Tax=Myroides odoratimimus TaxID=76832 RepID=UPI00293F46A7|nr:PD-(D/E)XK nuclease superfamily protein [Myroides odoratimimus]